jgi:hypothetical protein
VDTAAWKYGLAKDFRNFSHPRSFMPRRSRGIKDFFRIHRLSFSALETFTPQSHTCLRFPEKASPPSEEYSTARAPARRMQGRSAQGRESPGKKNSERNGSAQALVEIVNT